MDPYVARHSQHGDTYAAQVLRRTSAIPISIIIIIIIIIPGLQGPCYLKAWRGAVRKKARGCASPDQPVLSVPTHQSAQSRLSNRISTTSTNASPRPCLFPVNTPFLPSPRPSLRHVASLFPGRLFALCSSFHPTLGSCSIPAPSPVSAVPGAPLAIVTRYTSGWSG